MPGPVPGINVLAVASKDVNGRDRPGRDDENAEQGRNAGGGEAHATISM